MELVINGEKKTYRNGLSVSELLVEGKVEMPQYVSVQLNGAFLRRNEFDERTLRDGDQVEFLYYMGGGSAGGDGWS